MSSFVKVLTYTWSKDSHGLFDYESAHLFTGKFKITGQGQFFRNNNEICMKEANSHIDLTEESHLFDIQQSPLHKGIFKIVFSFFLVINLLL